MPTNILRARPKPAGSPDRGRAGDPGTRRILITAGRVQIRVVLRDTPTAERIWRALPLYTTAETWGDSVHFEVPVGTGRERGARLGVHAGEVCFWSEDHRVIIGFGRTPISRPGEIRLPSPCNLWADAIDDVAALKAVRPGEKVSMVAQVEMR